MFQQVIIPEDLHKFLNFNDLKSLININKYIHNMFLRKLHKRTMWDKEHLPRNYNYVYRLKLEWDDFAQLPYFTNLKELKMIYNCWDMSYFPNQFPTTLLSLHVGDKFATTFHSLPLNLKRLEFGTDCKIELVSRIFPENLEEIKFGDFCKIKFPSADGHERVDTREFSQECVFPKSLTRIEFGAGFSESLEPLCESNLQEIFLNRHFNGHIPDKLKDKVRFVCYEDYHTGWQVNIE
jgi:hypothetical protein